MVNGLLSGVAQLLTNVLDLIINLVTGISSSLNQIFVFIVRNFFLLPSLEGYFNKVDSLFSSVINFYQNATFEKEFLVFYKNIQRGIAILKSNSTPSTYAELQTEIANNQIYEQQYNEVITDYNSVFATNCSTTCDRNTTIQVANCSCFTSAETQQFLDDFYNTYVPVHIQIFIMYDKDVAQDYKDDIDSPAIVADTTKVNLDASNLYQEIYSSNGNVNQTDVAARLIQLSSDIQSVATAFANGPDLSDTFEGQAL